MKDGSDFKNEGVHMRHHIGHNIITISNITSMVRGERYEGNQQSLL